MTSYGGDALENPQQEIKASDGSTIQDAFQTTFGRSVKNVYIGTYTSSEYEKLNDYLARAAAVYTGRMSQNVAQFSQPFSPYKLLSSFRIEDESIFCGRTNDTKDLCEKVFRSRLLVLHAKSGAGKTSLLNAGLSPYVIRRGHLPVYIHTYDKDPTWVIKQTLIPATLGLWPDGLHDLALHEFLALICTCLKRDNNIEELILVLDQFEDFFHYWPQLSERLPFIQALGECYNDQALPIRIIIALRKDYYSDLTEFEQVLPHLHIFQNHYRPSAMTQEEAKEAIVKPLKKLDSTVTYEPVLLDALLADLGRNEIELPLLQMICTRLYETRGNDKKRITMKTYEALGKIEGVLTTYLNEVLAGLPEKEKVLVKNVLKEFVHSDMTKQTISYNTLIAQVETQENDLDRILAQLVNARLLYKDDIEGETRYELVHEYLQRCDERLSYYPILSLGEE